MAEAYKPQVNQNKGYAPHKDETKQRVGALQKQFDSFSKNPRQEIRVK